MRRDVRVCIGEVPRVVGTLRYDKQGARESAAFEYDASWLRAPDRFAIEPALPVIPGPQFHRKTGEGSAFHRAIADTAPDGWGRRIIMRDHAKRREAARRKGKEHDAPLTALDFLLAVDDASRVGALRFQDEAGTFQRTGEPGKRTTPPLIELSAMFKTSRAVETNSETLADLAYLRGKGTSLGGLRPKCTVIDDDGQLFVGKFPSVQDDRAVTKAEVLALQLAMKAGIDAAEARLVEADGVPVALIRRFDRDKERDRIGYISAATLIGADIHDGSEHSYTEIVDAIRVHGAAVSRDLEELWRRVAFSILITNTDDHLMNHGFLYDGDGRWRLSPAFDINPFPDRERELKTWISEDLGPAATIESLIAVAPYFQIKPAKVRQIMGEVETAVGKWRPEGKKLGMTKAELDALTSAFEHAEREAAKRAVK
jgi:serine/threonine-protein kinase HipA